MTNKRKSKFNIRGVSLVEAIIVVSALGILASVGVSVYSDTTESAQEVKAQSDLKAINRAVTFHLANYGDIPRSWEAADVIRALKSSLSDENAQAHVGFSQSTIDSRLTAIFVDPDLEDEEGPRIIWDRDNQEFTYEQEATGPGIVRFEISDQAEEETFTDLESSGSYSYARNSSWIWDFENEEDVRRPQITPSVIMTTNIEVTLQPEAEPVSAEAIPVVIPSTNIVR